MARLTRCLLQKFLFIHVFILCLYSLFCILVVQAVLQKTEFYGKKKKKEYLLLLHWVMNYQVCARKIVYYHFDKENQMTNIDIWKWQEELKTLIQGWGGYGVLLPYECSCMFSLHVAHHQSGDLSKLNAHILGHVMQRSRLMEVFQGLENSQTAFPSKYFGVMGTFIHDTLLFIFSSSILIQ